MLVNSRDKRLNHIKLEIDRLHKLKANCRKNASPITKMAFFAANKPHCFQCAQWTMEQKALRKEKRWILSLQKTEEQQIK